MANGLLLLVVILVLVGVYLYYTDSDIIKKICPNCARSKIAGKCPVCPECPACDLKYPHARDLLEQLAKGCSYRVRGVLRESAVSKNDVQYFLDGGDKRVVVVTNMVPEEFVKAVGSNDQDLLNQIKAVVLGSAKVAGTKTYMVMVINGGKMSPAGAPTTKFDDAFNYLQNRARNDVAADHNNNLVVYIDEDIECDSHVVTPVAELAPVAEEEYKLEKCCGRRRREGLQIIDDNEDLSMAYGDSMYDYYARKVNTSITPIGFMAAPLAANQCGCTGN